MTAGDIIQDRTLRLIDVGARGFKSDGPLRPLRRQIEYVGFEPDRVECDRLSRQPNELRSCVFHPYALGKTEKNRALYVTQLPDLCSLLPPSPNMAGFGAFRVVDVLQVDTISISDLFHCGVLSGAFDVIKLDTQGSELEILAHAGKSFLEGLLMVFCEVEFSEMYSGQPRLSEVEMFLRAHNFEPLSLNMHCAWAERAGVENARRKLTWADAAFMKCPHTVLESNSDVRDDRVRKTITMLALLGFFGEAIQLARQYLPDLERPVRECYETLKPDSLSTRARMLFRALRCSMLPTRKNRMALARAALRVGDFTRGYSLADIEKI